MSKAKKTKSKKTTKTFTKLSIPQTTFLEQYLRGTGKTLTEHQAATTYGIKNLRARMTDLRQAGLRVNRGSNTDGYSIYSVSSRDVNGSRAIVFAS